MGGIALGVTAYDYYGTFTFAKTLDDIDVDVDETLKVIKYCNAR
jgi:hypothetical protein